MGKEEGAEKPWALRSPDTPLPLPNPRDSQCCHIPASAPLPRPLGHSSHCPCLAGCHPWLVHPAPPQGGPTASTLSPSAVSGLTLQRALSKYLQMKQSHPDPQQDQGQVEGFQGSILSPAPRRDRLGPIPLFPFLHR